MKDMNGLSNGGVRLNWINFDVVEMTLDDEVRA
jgi:hypothetical protein